MKYKDLPHTCCFIKSQCFITYQHEHNYCGCLSVINHLHTLTGDSELSNWSKVLVWLRVLIQCYSEQQLKQNRYSCEYLLCLVSKEPQRDLKKKSCQNSTKQDKLVKIRAMRSRYNHTSLSCKLMCSPQLCLRQGHVHQLVTCVYCFQTFSHLWAMWSSQQPCEQGLLYKWGNCCWQGKVKLSHVSDKAMTH